MKFVHDGCVDSVPFPVTNHRLAPFDYSVKQASQTLSSPSCIPYTLRLWVRRLLALTKKLLFLEAPLNESFNADSGLRLLAAYLPDQYLSHVPQNPYFSKRTPQAWLSESPIHRTKHGQ